MRCGVSSQKNAFNHLENILYTMWWDSVIDESVILKWYEHPSKKLPTKLNKLMRDKCKTFVMWLKDNDEEFW